MHRRLSYLVGIVWSWSPDHPPAVCAATVWTSLRRLRARPPPSLNRLLKLSVLGVQIVKGTVEEKMRETVENRRYKHEVNGPFKCYK